MKLSDFKTINTIIERDSKDATYKFALLRSVIEIIQEYSQLKHESDDKVTFPLGLLIEKWILYYYPLIDSPIFLPQKNGETSDLTPGNRIAFREKFKAVTAYYSARGGFSAFYRDYKSDSLPEEVRSLLLRLIVSIRDTIRNMPMKHLGYSVLKQEYSVFRFNNDHKRISQKIGVIDSEYLINNFGTFSFDKQLYAVFEYLGSFITGTDSLLFKWAEFTAKADKSGQLTVENVFARLQEYPQTERDVESARVVYSELVHNSHLECVWSQKRIDDMNSLNIDHMIPFVVWRNNDLWNLLPSHKSINAKKRDKIPSLSLLDRQRDGIIYYWESLKARYEVKFNKEIHLSLLANDKTAENWQNDCFHHLKDKCEYLINIRGFEEWNI